MSVPTDFVLKHSSLDLSTCVEPVEHAGQEASSMQLVYVAYLLQVADHRHQAQTSETFNTSADVEFLSPILNGLP